MKFLIDFSWFYYQCKTLIINDKLQFTYSTDLKIHELQKINAMLFKALKEICNNSDFFDNIDLTKEKFHPIALNQRILIGKILKDYGEDENQIQQNIIDCEYIYQIKIKDGKRRLFFIFDKQHRVIRPLILDLNHLMYRNEEIENRYLNCLICLKPSSKCNKNLNEKI